MGRTLLLIGDYNRDENGRREGGITIYDFDLTTGDAIFRSVAEDILNPSFLAMDPERRLLAATSEVEEGELVVFDFDHANGRLQETGRQSTLGALPCHVAFDRTGNFLLVSNFGADQTGAAALVVFAAAHHLQPALSKVVHAGSGPIHPHQAGPHAHCAVPTFDNRFILVTDYGADCIYLYPFDSQCGELGPAADVLSLPPGSAPRTMVLSPNGKTGFVTAEFANSIFTFSVDTERGRLLMTGSTPTRSERSNFNYPAELRMSPDGRFLYAANRGDETIAIFEAGSQLPRLVTTVETGGRWPRCLALSDDGRHIVVANQLSGEIVAFADGPGFIESGRIIARHPAPAFVGFAAY